MKQDRSLQPADVLLSLNRAQQTIREGTRWDSIEAAEKCFYVCLKWLKDRGIKYYQTEDGRWALGG